MRTYLYKLTSDRGGAPCAPPPRPGRDPLLTLAICKPAIRRTAQPGDRLVGLTSRALEETSGYPPLSVIYTAVVAEIVDAAAYYAPRSPYRHRPDCIYRYDSETGGLDHTGKTGLHADPRHRRRDLGREGIFENGRVLLCREFTYLGAQARVLGETLPGLRRLASELGQGHRVVDSTKNPELHAELDRLFREMRRLPSRFTPRAVHRDAYDHPAPPARSAGWQQDVSATPPPLCSLRRDEECRCRFTSTSAGSAAGAPKRSRSSPIRS